MMPEFKKATAAEVDALVGLINASYRTRGSWTHECELLTGPRIGGAELAHILQAAGSHVETAWVEGELLACVHLRQEETCSLGLLSVLPAHQTQGLGRKMLDRAHELARSWNYTSVNLTVIAQRPELVAYYERRGYRPTGRKLPFPVGENVGEPRRTDLELVEMTHSL